MTRLFVLAVLLCVSTSLLADGRDDAERCRQEVFGDRSEYSGRLAGAVSDALEFCSRAIESGDLTGAALAAALHSRGLALGAAGRDDDAIADFSAAIGIDARHARAHFGRATALARTGKLEAAIADFDRSIALDPGYTLAYSGRGTCYRELGQFDRAIADYDEAIRRDPADSFAYESRGRAHFLVGRFGPAADDLAAAVQRAPENPYPVLWLYLARQRAGGKGLAELKRNATRLESDEWPGPVVDMYLGRSTPAEVGEVANSSDAAVYQARWCELDFYFAELLIAREPQRVEEIAQFLRKAVDGCPHDFMEHAGAVAEIKRLKQ